MVNQGPNPNQLQILMARKTEMDRLLLPDERVMDDSAYIMALLQMQDYCFNLSKRLFFDTDLDFPLNAEKNKNKFFDAEASVMLSCFATLINYTTLKFEHVFSDDSIFSVDELLEYCSIEDLSGNTNYGHTTEELKEVLWKIRCAISHNKEYKKDQGFYTGVNFTTKGNVMVHTSIKGVGNVYIKTDVDKLHKLFSQIDKQKETKKEQTLLSVASMRRRKQAKLDASIIDKMIFFETKVGAPAEYYFKMDSQNIMQFIAKYKSKHLDIIDDGYFLDHLNRRLKELYRTFSYQCPEILEQRNLDKLVTYIGNHCMLNSYPTTMLNMTMHLHEFTRVWDFSKSIKQNLFMFGNSTLNEAQRVERLCFLRNDLYPACVVNVAKFLFTNHQKELNEYIEEQMQNNTDVYQSLNYQESDLAERLRNSIHHGRFLVEYPDKKVFKQKEVEISLFDGKGDHHDFVLRISIEELAKITDSFGKYILKNRLATVQAKAEDEIQETNTI